MQSKIIFFAIFALLTMKVARAQKPEVDTESNYKLAEIHNLFTGILTNELKCSFLIITSGVSTCYEGLSGDCDKFPENEGMNCTLHEKTCPTNIAEGKGILNSHSKLN